MRGLPRRGAGGVALLMLGSCAMVPPMAGPPPPAPPPPSPQPSQAAQPVTPQRDSKPPERADFAYEGALIQGGVVLGTAPSGTVALRLDGSQVPVAPDGRFLIAFDRDADARATLVATLADGATVREVLTIHPRAWRIERLDRLPRVSQPSAEFRRRRPGELARIRAARAMKTGAQGWRQRFLWPVTGRISGRFGSQRIYRGEPGSYHTGVDVARPAGTPVIAPADGVVTLATEEEFTLEGKLLMLDHGMGLNSAFLHLSRIDVDVGDTVRRGQVIGAVGSSGRATGPHLHWSMKWNAARIDPLLLAGPMPGAE